MKLNFKNQENADDFIRQFDSLTGCRRFASDTKSPKDRKTIYFMCGHSDIVAVGKTGNDTEINIKKVNDVDMKSVSLHLLFK